MRKMTPKCSHFHLDNLQSWPILKKPRFMVFISCTIRCCLSSSSVSSLWELGYKFFIKELFLCLPGCKTEAVARHCLFL